MPYCSKCGHAIESDVNFCPKCGSSVTSVSTIENNVKLNVSESWKKKFEIFKNIGADKQFIFKAMATDEYKGLGFKEKQMIGTNGWALIFAAFYYFSKKMWAKGATILGASFIWAVLLTLVEIIWGTPFPSWANIGLSLVPGLVCSQLANYDYFRFVTQSEKMWNGFPRFMSKPLGALVFPLLALVLFIGIIMFVPDNIGEGKNNAEESISVENQIQMPETTREDNANIIIGTFNGCSTHQGVTECAINIKNKTIYISDSSTSESVFSNIDMENWIGKNVKLIGSMEAEGDYFIATSIELAE